MTTAALTDIVPAADLPGRLAAEALRLADDGTPMPDVVLVDLDDVDYADVGPLPLTSVVVGIARRPLSDPAHALARELACTVVPVGLADSPAEVGVADPVAAAIGIADAVRRTPRAAVALVNLLRATSRAAVTDGLVAESAVYSMLLAGDEFARWLATRLGVRSRTDDKPRVLVRRAGGTLDLTLDRPGARNAFDRAMRDELIDAFDVALADPAIEEIVLRGNGPAFCSGGDLSEFGRTTDVSTAHLIRLDRCVAARVDRCSGRLVARLHGACIGAGIEIPSFAGRIVARPDSYFQLPELAMGLVPGAGGTVGITHRIGRWRTAFLGLTGIRLDVSAALDWGLVDAVDD